MTSAETANKMMLAVCVSAAVMVIAGVVYYRSFEILPFTAGIAATSVLNIARIHMLKNVVEKAIDMETGKDAGNYVRIQYLLRFVLTGVVLIACALFGTRINHMSLFWGAVAGIFTMQIAAYFTSFFYKKHEKENKIQ
jgi:hypothetical protein